MKKPSLLLSSLGLLLTCSNAIASEEISEEAASERYDFEAALKRERTKPDQPFEEFKAETTQLFKKKKEATQKTEGAPVEKVNPATGTWYKSTRWNKQSWRCATWEPDDFVLEETIDLEQHKKRALAVLAAITQAQQTEDEIKPSALQAGHAEHFSKYTEPYSKKNTEEQIRLAENYALLIARNPDSPYFKAPEEEEKKDPNKITFGLDGQNGYIEYFVEGEKEPQSSWFWWS